MKLLLILFLVPVLLRAEQVSSNCQLSKAPKMYEKEKKNNVICMVKM